VPRGAWRPEGRLACRRAAGATREVAAVIAFLASPQVSYVAGASWPVDGGMLQMGPQAGARLRRYIRI